MDDKGVVQDQEQEVVDIKADTGRGLEPRTTAQERRSCVGCHSPLRGRQERFCSDRCRMQHRRAEEGERRRDLLDRLQGIVSQVRQEFAGEVEGER